MTNPRPLTEQEQAEMEDALPYGLDMGHDISVTHEEMDRSRAAIEALVRRCGDAERRAVLAEAHDRQPYPTAEAYDLVCKARDKWQARAEKAEAERDEARRLFVMARRDVRFCSGTCGLGLDFDPHAPAPWERPDAAEGAR